MDDYLEQLLKGLRGSPLRGTKAARLAAQRQPLAFPVSLSEPDHFSSSRTLLSPSCPFRDKARSCL